MLIRCFCLDQNLMIPMREIVYLSVDNKKIYHPSLPSVVLIALQFGIICRFTDRMVIVLQRRNRRRRRRRATVIQASAKRPCTGKVRFRYAIHRTNHKPSSVTYVARSY